MERIIPKVRETIEMEPASGFQIVVPTPDRWQEYRDLRLESLNQEPIAFIDPEEGRAKWLSRSEGEWRRILSGSREDGSETIVMMGYQGEEAVGMVQAVIPSSAEPVREAKIQHMFVDESVRGRGYGRKLLEELLQRLSERGDIERATLSVVVTQEAAQRLYRSMGFNTFKFTTDSAFRGEEWYDELEMSLPLK